MFSCILRICTRKFTFTLTIQLVLKYDAKKPPLAILYAANACTNNGIGMKLLPKFPVDDSKPIISMITAMPSKKCVYRPSTHVRTAHTRMSIMTKHNHSYTP